MIEGERVADPSLKDRIAVHKGMHNVVDGVDEFVREQNARHFGLQTEPQEDGTTLVTEAETGRPIAHTTSLQALIAVARLYRKVA